MTLEFKHEILFEIKELDLLFTEDLGVGFLLQLIALFRRRFDLLGFKLSFTTFVEGEWSKFGLLDLLLLEII